MDNIELFYIYINSTRLEKPFPQFGHIYTFRGKSNSIVEVHEKERERKK